MRVVDAALTLLAFASIAKGIACAAPTTQADCTLTFTESAATQIAPTTTLYDAIVTTTLNIVDCQHCTVVNVIETPSTVQGPFTAKVTLPVLTVHRAGCIPEEAVSTRGFSGTDGGSSATTQDLHPTESSEINKRALNAAFLPEIAATTSRQILEAAFLPEIAATTFRRDQAEDLDANKFIRRTLPDYGLDKRVIQSEQELASGFVDLVDPGNFTVMQSIQEYRRQCYSAFVAVGLIISGVPPQLLCNLTKTPELQLPMTQKGLDGQQVADLICFWSVYGYHFGVSEYQVLDTLATAATSFTYAMQYGLNSTSDVVRLCNGLNLNDDLYEMLHIDSQGIYTVLCNSAVGTSSGFTSSSTITAFVSETASASSGQVVWTSWGSSGSVLITVPAGGISWSNAIGNGSASATLGSAWTLSGGNATFSSSGTAASGGWSSGEDINATAVASGVPFPTGADSNATASSSGAAATGSWSIGWGANATGTLVGSGVSPQPFAPVPFSTVSRDGTIIVVGSGSGIEPTLSVTTFTDSNGSVIVSGTAAIAATPSWTLSNATATSVGSLTTAASSPSTSNATSIGSGTPGIPGSWATFTNANGSVVVSGSAASTSWGFVNGTSIVAPTGGANASSWSSASGNASIVVGSGVTVTYTGVAWTSWIVSNRPTAAIITGTSASIPWGTGSATAIISGSAQTAAFTVVVSVTKTIIVVATAFGQTWTAWGASSGFISGVGTAGTWTLDSTITNSVNGSAVATTGSVITDAWNTTQAIPGAGNGTVGPTATGVVGPGAVPLGTAVTATGLWNFTSTVIDTATTSLAGNASAVVNVTQVTTGFANTTTIISGSDIPSGIATIGTAPVTTNVENITFSILSATDIGTISFNDTNENATFSILPWTSSKFSYPAWTTSTSTSTA